MPELIQTRWGFYQFSPLPSDEELQQYYRDKYYQNGCGSYEVEYSEEELRWLALVADLHRRMVNRFLPSSSPKRLLDIGCGEGHLMNAFFQEGHEVKGMDFSQAGMLKLHPHLLDYLDQGNIFSLIKKYLESGATYDVISLMNVMEHVKDPVGLLRDMRCMLKKDSLLVVKVPNDFSPLHDLLRSMGKRDRWWVGYPDHLSYFNKQSMEQLLTDLEFVIHSVMADNPVDLLLLNDESDYITDRSKGKKVHHFRMRMDNFLGDIDRDKMLDVYSALGGMGVGRCLTFFASPINL